MNEQSLQKLFATLDPEEIIEKLQEFKDDEETKELVKHQLGQEFIKLLAVAESLEIDFEDAINDAISELEVEHEECDPEDDECCDKGNCKS